ncbi:hypothetical protein [Burkholderia pseudomallei]
MIVSDNQIDFHFTPNFINVISTTYPFARQPDLQGVRGLHNADYFRRAPRRGAATNVRSRLHDESDNLMALYNFQDYADINPAVRPITFTL